MVSLRPRPEKWSERDSLNLLTSSSPGSGYRTISGRDKGKGSFPPSQTFWLFLSQVLGQDTSCRETLSKFLAWLAMEEGRSASPNTAGYCKARKRLPLSDLEKLHGQTLQKIQASADQEETWRGRRVKVVDGSGLSMPDTKENQEAYPQSKTQKPGCGFPVMRIVVVFSLATGAILDLAKGALSVAERTLFRSLWSLFEPDDVILADCGFCSYADFYFLAQQNIDCVMGNHHRRKVGLELVEQFCQGDRLIYWLKMRPCPKWLDKKDWQAVPDKLLIREITFSLDIPGFRTKKVALATTLLDPLNFPKQAFAQLYRRRWMAELFLRDIKTSMGMDILRCKTPDMIHKELLMNIFAYNLIRTIMLQAAQKHHLSPSRISFKGTMGTIRQWAPLIAARRLDQIKQREMKEALLTYLARDRIPNRPNRNEPRARKRRPKNYQLLNKPRHTFKEIPHRNKYNKTLS